MSFRPPRHTVNLPSARVSYLAAGPEEGQACLLLHGGGTDSAELSWSATIPVLASEGFRVYAPDHPGYGHSPLPSWPITTANLVAYIREFIAALELKRIVVCGLSMGGAMGLGLALQQPSVVERLVLVGTYGVQDRTLAHRLAYFAVRLPGVPAMNTVIARSPRLVRQALRPLVRDETQLTPELVEDVRTAMRNRDTQRAFNQWQRSEVTRTGTLTNYTKQLGDIQQPTLLVHGSRDASVPLAAVERAADLLPNATLKVLHNAGHWTQRDQPEQFHTVLLEFLRQ